MAHWEYKLNIRQHLNNDDDTLVIAENVAKELGTVPGYIFGGLPQKLVAETKAAIERIPDDKDYHELAFNRVLERIYDAADDYRVWLGL